MRDICGLRCVYIRLYSKGGKGKGDSLYLWGYPHAHGIYFMPTDICTVQYQVIIYVCI